MVGLGAQGTSTMYNRWKSADRAKVGNGRIVAERYRGTASCGSCKQSAGAGATFSFSATERPRSTKHRKLVNQLAGFGITRGKADCGRQGPKRQLTCAWSASGSFSPNRTYECASKAWWKGKRWQINVCKDALGAQLWHRLEQEGLTPTYAGGCKELSGNRFRCKWYAKGVFASGQAYFCQGGGVYDASKHRWQIDPCRNERG